MVCKCLAPEGMAQAVHQGSDLPRLHGGAGRSHPEHFPPASPSNRLTPNASSYKGGRGQLPVKGQGFVGGAAGAEGEGPLCGWTPSSTWPKSPLRKHFALQVTRPHTCGHLALQLCPELGQPGVPRWEMEKRERTRQLSAPGGQLL